MHFTNGFDADPKPITGLILAGGKSTRMAGQNKAQMQFAGTTLLLHSCDILADSVESLLISCGRYNYDLVSQKIGIALPDSGEQGPLGGILAGLKWVQNNAAHHWLAVMPCDTPLIPRNWLSLLCDSQPHSESRLTAKTVQRNPLISTATQEAAAHMAIGASFPPTTQSKIPRYVRSHEVDHYAHALWPVDAIPAIEEALEKREYAIRSVLSALGSHAIDISPHCSPESFLNINKLEDLVKAKQNLPCKSFKKQPK